MFYSYLEEGKGARSFEDAIEVAGSQRVLSLRNAQVPGEHGVQGQQEGRLVHEGQQKRSVKGKYN